MSGWGTIIVSALLPLALVALVVVLLVRAVGRHRPRVTPAWHRVQAVRVAGAVVGLVLAGAVYGGGTYGTGPMLAPAVLGLGVVVGVALGETVVRPRRPAGARTASLVPRRVRDYLPPVTTPLVGAVLGLEVVTLVLTTLTATRDDTTAQLRALGCSTAAFGSLRTPYPGAYYSGPLAAVLAAVLLVAAAAAVQVVRRPRGLGHDDVDDDALRHRSLQVVVAATGLALSATYAGIAAFAGGAMRALAQETPSLRPGVGPAHRHRPARDGAVRPGRPRDLPGAAAGRRCLAPLLDRRRLGRPRHR